MKIRGREINFLRTVKTTCDLAEICPDKDINRLGEIFNGSIGDAQKNAAILIRSLNEGYEMNKHFDNPDYQPNIISIDEILFLSQEEYTELLNEAMKVFSNVETTVEAEKSKKKTETK